VARGGREDVARDKRARRHKPSPDDVIAGRAHLRARDLCSMIHDVNPSGRPLPPAEAARRYAQKSRLQSLLIREFASETEVRPEPNKEGVISLRHRPTGADACHAVLAELDEDARSWAQRELDLGTFGAPSSHPVPERTAPERTSIERASPDRARPEPSVEPVSSPDPGPPSSESAQHLPASELVLVGERAIEAFDYDIAQRRLAAALERSGGAAAPAVALLSLLVERLGADREAIELRGRLSAEAIAEPKVRHLLAVAAARLADRESAMKFLKNLPASQAAEVFAALARASIESGDLETGARDLAQASALNPLREELAGLSELLQRRRAEQRGPLEEEVRRLIAESRFDEAEPRARELLRRWPESHVGRWATRAVEEHKRALRARELYAKAEEAIAKGDATDGLSLLKQAIAGGLSEESAEAARRRVAALEAEARARKEQAEIDEVCRQLKEADLTEGLRAYLALPDPQRREVRERERAAIPQLGWLEEASAQGSGARGKAAVSAVVALGRAIEIAQSNPGSAIDLLEQHSKALQGVGAAQGALKEARARREEQQVEDARARVEAARRALDEGGEGAAGQAEEILGGAVLREAPEAVRGEVEELRARIKAAAARQAMVTAFETYRRGEQILLARNTADELARTAPDEAEKQRWTTVSADIREAIQRLFHVQVQSEPTPAGALVDFVPPRDGGALRLLLPGSQRVVLAQAFDEYVFLRVLDPESATIRACITLFAMSPFELIRAEAREEREEREGREGREERVILMSRRGAVLEVALESGELLRRYFTYLHKDASARRAPAAPPREPSKGGEGAPAAKEASAGRAKEPPVDVTDEPLLDAQMAPGSRLCWLVWEASLTRHSIRIVRIEQARPSREIATSSSRVCVSPLFGMKEPRMGVLFEDEEKVAFFDVHGAAAGGGSARVRGIAQSMTACPDGEHVFLLAREQGGEVDGTEDPAGWVCLPQGRAEALAAREDAAARRGATFPVHRIEGLRPEAPVAVATNAAARMIYVLFRSQSGENELLGLTQPADPARSADLCEVFRVPAPRRTTLLEEPGSGRVAALVMDDDGVRVADLGRDAPALRASADPGDLPEELMTAAYSCGLPVGPALSAIATLIGAIRREDYTGVLKRIAAATKRDDPDHLVALALALVRSKHSELAGRLLARAHERHPTHAWAALENASSVLQFRDWSLALEVLQGIDPGGLDAGRAQHFYHVVATAKLHLNEPEEALVALERGRALTEGRCDLDCLIALASPLGEESEGEAAWSAEQAAVRELVRAVALADARLERGDAAGARLALDRRVVWEAREIQSLARLAEAHLAEEEAAPYARFRKALALAAFRATAGDFRALMRREVPFPRALWDRARIDALSERARAWLVESLGDKMVAISPRHAPYVGGEAPETEAGGRGAPETEADGREAPETEADRSPGAGPS
jgi:hypothetical protein